MAALRAGLAALALSVGFAGGAGAAPRVPDPYRAEVVVTSADLSRHLTRLPDVEFGGPADSGEPVIGVDAGRAYQRVEGFGAAMTDTSAWLIERRVGQPARQALFDRLFGRRGIRLDFVRVPMGASDFTHDGRPYTYDDMPAGTGDPRLRHFSIAHDRPYILPALRAVRRENPQVELLASPWTPPAWMKSNRALGNAGNSGRLLPSAYGPWGRYFARFLRAYAAAGLPVDAITPQNEPGTPTLYPGLNLSSGSEGTWIANDLRPALAAAGLHPKIYGGDLGWGPHNDAFMRAAIFGPAGRALAGLSWHCYFGAPDVMDAFRRAAPRLDEIVDECSPGLITPTPTSEIVIASLREWASTVALWNLALDSEGGPVEIPNHGCPGCVGLVSIDQGSGAVSMTRSYYQLGQASSFIAAGARRIASTHFVSYVYPGSGVNVVTPGLDDVAVRNPDGSLVLIAYDNAPTAIRFAVRWRRRTLSYALAPGAMVTLAWNRSAVS